MASIYLWNETRHAQLDNCDRAVLFLRRAGTAGYARQFCVVLYGGLFFLFWAAIEQWFMRKAISNRWLYWAGNILFTIHLVSGIRYFVRVLGGGSYM